MGKIYVRRINIGECATGDSDGDGLVASNDLTLFADRFAAGSPQADVNLSGQLDTQDFVDYMDAYSAVGPP